MSHNDHWHDDDGFCQSEPPERLATYAWSWWDFAGIVAQATANCLGTLAVECLAAGRHSRDKALIRQHERRKEAEAKSAAADLRRLVGEDS